MDVSMSLTILTTPMSLLVLETRRRIPRMFGPLSSTLVVDSFFLWNITWAQFVSSPFPPTPFIENPTVTSSLPGRIALPERLPTVLCPSPTGAYKSRLPCYRPYFGGHPHSPRPNSLSFFPTDVTPTPLTPLRTHQSLVDCLVK